MEPEKWQDPALEPREEMQRSPAYIILSLAGTGLFLVGMLGYAQPGILQPISPWLERQASEHWLVFLVSGLVVYLVNGLGSFMKAKEKSRR